jgi:TRAP-type C4-dicarboxylate transport system permease large subunit
MSPISLTVLIFILMVGLMALRTPIAVAMFVAGSIGYVAQAGWAPYSFFLNEQAFARFASYDLSVIPLFILMGHFASQGGISKSLFEFASVVMGRFRGGLAMGAVVASAAFGAICGSSIATAATITTVALPEMRRHGYSGRLATGTLAAGGTLGILIPPSVPLLVYAILTEQNIAKLFAAAMVPGLIAMIGYIIAISIYVRLVPGQAPDRDEAPPRLTWHKFKHCFYATAQASAMIFLIFIGADMMNSALALTQVPMQLAKVVNEMGLSPLLVVTAILLLYAALGCIMDELSILLLTIPIFFPMVIGLDFGMPRESVAIWFGILVLMTVGFGLLSPPVGLNVYVVNGMAEGVPIGESYRGVLPFLASDALRTLLLLLFPPVSLWLVQYVG